jgi:hypothetical protein
MRRYVSILIQDEREANLFFDDSLDWLRDFPDNA